MTLARVALLGGVALGVVAAGVLVSILYMVVYGHVIDRGHDQAYYDAHVQKAAPYIGIVAGIPLMFLAGWWVAGWDITLAVRSALIVWGACAVIDLAVLAAWGFSLKAGVLVGVSLLTKLCAVYFGALTR